MCKFVCKHTRMKQAKFYIEKRKDKTGNPITENVPIRMSFSFDGKRLEYYTQQRISNTNNFLSDYVKKGKSPVKSNEPQAGRINKSLKDLGAKAELLYDNAIALGNTPTVEYIKSKLDEQFKGRSTTPEQKLVSDAYEEYLKHTKEKKSIATWKKVQTVLNHLKENTPKAFDKLTFDKINPAFVEKFRSYFIKEGYVNNTVVKYLQTFRSFLIWAKNDKRLYYTGTTAFDDLQENEINVIFLSAKDIEHLENTKMPTESLERVKDIYLFGVYTGMRYGDIAKLKKKDVEDEDIRFYINKGNETTWHFVPLVQQSKKILARYSGIDGEKALPVLSNQKMNLYLKHVMREAKFNAVQTIRIVKGDGSIVEKDFPLWELITCHTSRKSFISLAVERGMKEIDIKSITGHSKNSRAFTKYYEVSPEKKRKEMRKVFAKSAKLKAV